MNPLWDAAQALIALVQECLGDLCEQYGRVIVTTGLPVADCDLLAVSIGNARAQSGSCVGRAQLHSHLDVNLVRCCEPVGDLSSGGYTPPTPAQIEAAAACIVRDAWSIYQCLLCVGCESLGAINGVVACCDDKVGAPEIIWSTPSGGCRSAIVRVPIIFTVCCPPAEPSGPVFESASSPACGTLEILGQNLDLVGCIGIKRPGNSVYSDIGNDPRWTITPTSLTLLDDTNLGGSTIIEIIACTEIGCDCIDFATNPGNVFDEIVNIPVADCP